MKIITNNILPLKGYSAITLFGLVFALRELTEVEKNHELIHIRQGNEILWIPFYLWYVIEWSVRLIQYLDTKKAYYNISFEREAYANDANFNYKNARKFWSFLKYLKAR